MNVRTVSVDFLRILDAMGVEARTTQYDKSESSHFLFNIIKTIKMVNGQNLLMFIVNLLSKKKAIHYL